MSIATGSTDPLNVDSNAMTVALSPGSQVHALTVIKDGQTRGGCVKDVGESGCMRNGKEKNGLIYCIVNVRQVRVCNVTMSSLVADRFIAVIDVGRNLIKSEW